jgi:hypothetical protein
MSAEEIWRAVPGYPTYSVSNLGNVIGPYGSVLQTATRKGYYSITCSQNGTTKNMDIHRMVAMAFLPNPENLPTVDHKDRNRLNNDVQNLRWASRSAQAYNRGSRSKLYPKGVGKSGDRFKASVRLDGEQFHLGVFDTVEDAAAMYLAVVEGLGLVPEVSSPIAAES